MDYTQSIGNVVELQCISKFIELGFQCSIPYGNSARYDFIAELPNGELIKIQCKSSVWTKGTKEDKTAFHFSCQSSTTNTKETIKYSYTNKEIDYFATYFEGKVYVVPVDECSTTKTLRFSPPKNGNLNYNKAEDYEIEKIFGHLQDKNFVQNIKNHKIQIENTIKDTTNYKCKICGSLITIKDGVCTNCSHLLRRKTDRPNRETLKQLIRTTPFIQIGKQFGVSDNTIRKWCAGYGLPQKSREIKSYSDEDWDKI